jgi:hypothetical protein
MDLQRNILGASETRSLISSGFRPRPASPATVGVGVGNDSGAEYLILGSVLGNDGGDVGGGEAEASEEDEDGVGIGG